MRSCLIHQITKWYFSKKSIKIDKCDSWKTELFFKRYVNSDR